MFDFSSILAAYPPSTAERSSIPLLSAAEGSTGGAGPVLLLLAVGMLVVALQCLRRALAPVAMFVKSAIAAGTAGLLMLTAAALVIVAIASGMV